MSNGKTGEAKRKKKSLFAVTDPHYLEWELK
jgi:hypothetical protein